MTNNPKSLRQIYNDKYALWTQLYGCIGIFGSFFVAIWEIPTYVGLPMISIFMFISGSIFCTVNMAIEKDDFKTHFAEQEQRLIDKINKGELPQERLDMFRRSF